MLAIQLAVREKGKKNMISIEARRAARRGAYWRKRAAKAAGITEQELELEIRRKPLKRKQK